MNSEMHPEKNQFAGQRIDNSSPLPDWALAQKYLYKHIFEFRTSFLVLVLSTQTWGAQGGASLQKLKSGPHTMPDWVNKSVQLCMLTHFNGSTTDLYILTRVSKYTEKSQADRGSLKPVQILSSVTELS